MYLQEDGSIGSTQYYMGIDDIEEVYDYPSAESREELVKQGEERLLELTDGQSMQMDVARLGIEVGIGDIVGGRDYITGTRVSKPVINKIYKEENGTVNIDYIVEGETENEDTIQ